MIFINLSLVLFVISWNNIPVDLSNNFTLPNDKRILLPSAFLAPAGHANISAKIDINNSTYDFVKHQDSVLSFEHNSTGFQAKIIRQGKRLFFIAPAHNSTDIIINFNYEFVKRRSSITKLKFNRTQQFPRNRFSFLIEDMTLDEYLANETNILKYFNEFLKNNDSVTVWYVYPDDRNRLMIELSSNRVFSWQTTQLTTLCPKSVELPEDKVSATILGMPENDEFKVIRCSFKVWQTDNNPHRFNQTIDNEIQIHINVNKKLSPSSFAFCLSPNDLLLLCLILIWLTNC